MFWNSLLSNNSLTHSMKQCRQINASGEAKQEVLHNPDPFKDLFSTRFPNRISIMDIFHVGFPSLFQRKMLQQILSKIFVAATATPIRKWRRSDRT
ncbi:hypothetical protein NPIL_524581 [Nephila pilipes]|uniref:Uncharacterized protein n=1 Tax=Nephila pilipes TaxID=299642 RepID=A0A8X6QRE6_NEPPI|nr:hypothetical protein NPIL_524581 [Nephila pilipes]